MAPSPPLITTPDPLWLLPVSLLLVPQLQFQLLVLPWQQSQPEQPQSAQSPSLAQPQSAQSPSLAQLLLVQLPLAQLLLVQLPLAQPPSLAQFLLLLPQVHFS